MPLVSHSNNLLLREERKTRSLQAAGEAAAFIWRSTVVGTVTLVPEELAFIEKLE